MLIVEASAAGCRLQSNTEFTLHKPAVLRVEMGADWVEVPFELRWQRPIKDKDYRHEYGGMYARELSDRDRKDLSRYLFGDPELLLRQKPESRKFVRVPLRDNLMASEEFAVGDVSELGVGALSRSEMAEGTVVDLDFRVGKVLVQCKGQVVSCVRAREGTHYKVGIAFQDLPAATRAQLAEALLEILEKRTR